MGRMSRDWDSPAIDARLEREATAVWRSEKNCSRLVLEALVAVTIIHQNLYDT